MEPFRDAYKLQQTRGQDAEKIVQKLSKRTEIT